MKSVLLAIATLLATGLSASGAQAQALTPKESLGKSIFFDSNLSIHRNQSCAACHDPAAGWTGPDSIINAHGSVYEGSIPGRFGDRKPPSSAYATQSPILYYTMKGGEALFIGGNFWDGRATGEKLGNAAADQAQGPFLNPMEQALPESACVVYRVCTASYPVRFTDVWGYDACHITWPANTEALCATQSGYVPLSDVDRARVSQNYDGIALSIAAYEASPESNAFTSKFEYARTGMAKLTAEEQKGFSLFMGKGKCAACHVTTPASKGGAPFTDYTYDNLGLPKNPENPVYTYNPTFIDKGLGGFLATRPEYAKFAPTNMGKQKVPTVRNVGKGLESGLVKAYGHNGYFKSLEGIVHFYNTRDVKPMCPGAYTEAQALAAGCWPAPEVAENVNTAELGDLRLTTAEERAIVAFLKVLSDGYRP
jgi:cytochrome c peroxidase